MISRQKFDYEDVSIAVNRDKTKDFYKKIYAKKPELRRVVEIVRAKKGRILDIGCGGGLMSECLPEYFPKARVYGCDISKTAIKYAKEFSNGKVSYKVMKKRFPYPSSYFDTCLALDVLEHVPDVDFFINEVRRVLKKDGVLFAAIPCEGQPFTLSWFFKKIGFWENLTRKHVGHIHPEFTHEYVINLFSNKGFHILRKRFSERLQVQFIRYFLFMVPKEILEFLVGSKKAAKYNDSSTSANPSRRIDAILLIKVFLYKFRDAIKLIDDIDAEQFKDSSFSAWKINLLVSNNKKVPREL